ncbi:MAG: hypothetical protein AAF664_09920 [Planctomycetota bacterium]
MLTFSRPRRLIAVAVLFLLIACMHLGIHVAGYRPAAFGGFLFQQLVVCTLSTMVAFLFDGIVLHED